MLRSDVYNSTAPTSTSATSAIELFRCAIAGFAVKGRIPEAVGSTVVNR
jgi:hypothetical protein